MSQRNYKSDLVILGVLVALGVLACLYLGGGRNSSQEQADADFRPSSLSSDPNGMQACYLLYQRMGLPVGRLWTTPRSALLAGRGALAILGQWRRIDAGERTLLEAWITGGGVVICDVGVLHSLHGMKIRYDHSHPDGGFSGPLARDVHAAAMDRSEDLEDDDSSPRGGRDTFEPLLSAGQRVLIAQRTLGRGRIIVLSDPGFLSNAHLDKDDNSVLAMNLGAWAVAGAGRNEVVFDEFHLGFGEPATGWTLLTEQIFGKPAGWALLCVGAGGVLYMVFAGRRFGPRRPPPGRRRRTKLEFVHAAGATCRAAKANSFTFTLLYRRVRRLCAERGNLAASADDEQIAEALERLGRRGRREYQALLARCSAVTTKQRLSGARLKEMLGLLADLELEIGDGHTASKRNRAARSR